MRALRFARLWRATAWLLLAVVMTMSLIPNPPSPPDILGWDKLQHTIAWGLLAWWFLQAWEGRRPIGWCLFLLAVAAIVELLQGATGYRTSDALDMLANTVGVALGFTLWYTPLGGTFNWAEGWAAGLRWQ